MNFYGPAFRCFVIPLLLTLSAHAQKNFQDGYVIRKNGDTLKGQIDYKEWTTNPRSISFQEAGTGKITVWSPEDLRAFFVGGEKYSSTLVQVYPYSRDVAVFTSSFFDPAPYQKTVFLRSITEGKISLYGYIDSISGANYFFISLPDGGAPRQLRLISDTVDVNGHNMFQLRETYKDQLSVDLADCKAVSRSVRRTPYEEGALRKLIFSYNHCGVDTVEKREAGGKGIMVRITPMAGYSISKARFTGNTAITPQAGFPAYGSLTGGLGVLFILPKNRQQFAILTDVLYQHFYSKSGLYRTGTYLTNDGVLDYNQVKLDLQFRYRYPAGRVRPFVQAGISNNIVTGNKNYMDTYDQLGNTTQQSPFLGGDFRTYALGLLAGIGVEAGRFSLECRFESGSGFSDATSVGSSITSGSLLLGFRL